MIIKEQIKRRKQRNLQRKKLNDSIFTPMAFAGENILLVIFLKL